jgi:glutamate synthase domain-containing protein 2
MAKMGISTLASYKGAQIFEALGLDDEVGGQWWFPASQSALRCHHHRTQARAFGLDQTCIAKTLHTWPAFAMGTSWQTAMLVFTDVWVLLFTPLRW